MKMNSNASSYDIKIITAPGGVDMNFTKGGKFVYRDGNWFLNGNTDSDNITRKNSMHGFMYNFNLYHGYDYLPININYGNTSCSGCIDNTCTH